MHSSWPAGDLQEIGAYIAIGVDLALFGIFCWTAFKYRGKS